MMRAAATTLGDYAMSVLLSAVALWLGAVLWEAVAAFIMWRPMGAPGWLAFRIALVISAAFQAWPLMRKGKNQ